MDIAAFTAFITSAAPFLRALDLIPFGVVWFLAKWLILPAYALWLFFLAVMNLKRARDTVGLTKVAYAFAYPILAVGLTLDFFVTVTLGTLVFADLPREGTLTDRLKRYVKQPGTWRSALSLWIALHLLDRFDPAGWHVMRVASEAPDGSIAHQIAVTEVLAMMAATGTQD